MTTKRFAVTGSGAFPLDMLRYDSCWPYSERDAALIETTIRGGTQSQTIVLLADERNFAAPTEGRWISFNWKVTNG